MDTGRPPAAPLQFAFSGQESGPKNPENSVVLGGRKDEGVQWVGDPLDQSGNYPIANSPIGLPIVE